MEVALEQIEQEHRPIIGKKIVSSKVTPESHESKRTMEDLRDKRYGKLTKWNKNGERIYEDFYHNELL